MLKDHRNQLAHDSVKSAEDFKNRLAELKALEGSMSKKHAGLFKKLQSLPIVKLMENIFGK